MGLPDFKLEPKIIIEAMHHSGAWPFYLYYSMLKLILWCALWLVGYMVAFVMQRTEIAAEKQPYTFGDRLLIAAMSLLSWAWVLVILVTAWVAGIKRTGFWAQPVTPAPPQVAAAEEPKKEEPKQVNKWPRRQGQNIEDN